MFLTVLVFVILNIYALLSNVVAVFNTLHTEALDGFSTFKLLSHAQERCTRAAEVNKLDFVNFKRKCDNVLSVCSSPWQEFFTKQCNFLQ